MTRPTDTLPMPGSYFKLVLDLVGTTAARRRALLEGTGIAPENLERVGSEITLGQQLRQIRNVNRLMPAGWGLAIGARLHTETHGPLGFGAVSAPTLGAGLELIARFAHVRNPSFDAIASLEGRRLRLTFHERCELLEEERRPLIDTFLLSIQAMIESIVVRGLDRGHVEIVGRPSYAPLYRDYFRVDVRCDSDHDALVVPADWLSRRCPLADPEMYESSLRRLELAADRARGNEFTVARVARLLASGGDAGLPLEAVARRLGLSPRTLMRRLREFEVTYRDLRDAHRHRCAEKLLAEPVLPIAEIAARLGYEDTSNFSRACHRWFGCAPGAMRGRLRENAELPPPPGAPAGPSELRGRVRPG